MSNQPCLSEQDLKAFCIGQLDPQRSDEIVAHLSVCARCEETVAALDNTDDSLLQGVREAANRQPPIAVSESAAQPDPDAAVATSEQELLRSIPNPWTSAPETNARIPMNEWIRDYELLEPLGQGGMGTVYKARHARLNRAVAIKLLPARRLRDAAAVSRFEREMKAIGCLDHPAIVRATDAGDAEGTHFLVMDFVDGIDLSQVVKLTGPLDVATACEVIRQAAAGLQYAHEQGLIHRDVKPGNLMVTLVSGNTGTGGGSADMACVKLLDLGLALFGAASEAVDELTTVGQLMGTLDYMAPEQADNCHDVDVRADVYSLGATLFKLLTGTAPYETSERQSPLRKMKALATVDAPPVQSRRPELLSDIAAITDRMLQREPEKRYQTAAEVARAVTPLCADHQLVERTKHALRLRAERVEPDAIRWGNAPSEPAHAIREGEAPAEPLTPRSSILKTAQQELRPPGMSPAIAGNQSKPPRRRGFQILLATMGFFILLAAGVLFRIETDRGTLVIECAADNVPVEIRQGNVPVKQLSVSAGKNQVTLRSGEYEVIIPAEYETLHVESGKFELRRGDQWVARIVEEPRPQASGGRQSPDPSSNDFNVQQNDLESVPSSSPDYSLLSLQQLHELYRDEVLKWRGLNEQSLTLVATLGVEHPKVKDVSRRMIPVADRLQELVDAMSHRTTEPDPKRPDNTGAESSEPASGLFFLDPLQQIEFEAARDRYAMLLKKIPELEEQIQSIRGQEKDSVTGMARREEFTSLTKQLARVRSEKETVRLGLMQLMADLKKSTEQAATKEANHRTPSVDDPGKAERRGTRPSGTHTGTDDSPTFQGRTFDEWKSILTTERSDEELAKAVEAIGTLGRGTREPEAIELILKVVEQSPPVTLNYSSAPKSVLAAVRMIRTYHANSVATALIAGFADRSDRLQAFAVFGLMNFPDAYPAETKEIVRLGESLPIRHAMISSEAFALELTRVVEKRSGLKTGDPALTQQVFSMPRGSNSDWVPIYATGMIFEYIGRDNPSPDLEKFLTRLLDHLAQTPQDQKLAPEAQNAASILARVSPNEKLAGIFIRSIREAIISANDPIVNHGGFALRNNSELIDSFEGLLLLGVKAESAVAFMLEIIGKPAPEGTMGFVLRPNQIFHEVGLFYLIKLNDGDEAAANANVAVIQTNYRGFAANLRLLAMEVIVSSGTKDSRVLDLLRAELKQQLGQEPTDGPHELVSGRGFLLLRDDPNAMWKGPGTIVHPRKPVPSGGGGIDGVRQIRSATPTSPLDVELVNSTLLAWKSITGSWPRFAEPSLGQLGNRTPQELGQSEVNSEKTLEFIPKFQPVAGLQP